MLDVTTKRKIDSARQILVGKVPDPKQQVDQITTALVYKFMDDMDKESQELGGKAKFFTNGFEKYSWTKLMDKRLSGQQRLDLYVQAITNMSKNPHIPQLFRDIFKGAFLPYNDPETLSLFLKEINGFTYDHSEDLGDAFEYLLSILGSQGEAGQFRTPRHIIDFIVEIVDPKKNETILDPACGTAGFLISAYKHILKQSKDKPLTPDEKKKLMNHFVGYDISPDMVKLSLVNLYLHGFPEPKIYEYDTLTSEKHWGEHFDVIMANPPFMTPKGGIRPHNRFSVQASRSEVLFVDYILEHLNLKGRAGIIVPEGIIFKTENAYKQLREMLIENGLFAVVSLPPGVFNPYSGVKTSILFCDNQLAKKTDEIMFLKIENDGFDLGAQRRKIDKNDLPEALEVLEAWKNGKKQKSGLALWVKKGKIAESGDYNLTGERYKETAIRKNQKWPLVELGDEQYFQIESGGTPDSKKKEYWGGKIAWVTLVDLPPNNRITVVHKTERTITELGLKKSSAKLLPENSVLVSSRATIGRIGIAKIPLATNQGFKNIIIKDFSKVDPLYIANVLTQKVKEMQRLGTGGTYKEISKSNFSKIKIPLPPLEVQKEIVEQIEVKQNAINHAKEVIKNLEREKRYFGQEIRKLKDVKWVEMENVADTFTDGNWIESKDQSASGIRLIQTGNVGIGAYLDKGDKARFISDDTFKRLKCIEVFEGDVLISRLPDPVGRACLIPELDTRAITAVDCTIVRFDQNKIIPKFFVLYSMTDDYFESLGQFLTGSSRSRISRSNLAKVKIPLPPLEVQKQLVAKAEKEEEIITANRRLIELMERKIEEVLSDI